MLTNLGVIGLKKRISTEEQHAKAKPKAAHVPYVVNGAGAAALQPLLADLECLKIMFIGCRYVTNMLCWHHVHKI